LVTTDAACALDIVMLGRRDPYQLVTKTGDIDARVKTLLDGLRMPQQCSEVGGQTPRAGENPFFVLLEDDNVIYELNVTTGPLYMPPVRKESPNDVFALIRVRTRTFSGNFMNIHDLGP
jgi:hypothetical protein